VDDELTSKPATELIQLIKTGATCAVEVVESYLRRIERINPSLNAIVTISPDVLDRARAQDARRREGSDAGPLHGLPITVKDTIDTEAIRTTYGSRLFADNLPARDAKVIARLKAAGAIILGKTNTPEMALPYETDNPVFGRTNNPHDPHRTPGGSSGGEAAAVAARLSPAGVGSDLSGSIRVPAHFCGIAALKPTTAAVSMDGHVPRAAGTLALGGSIGPMARCVADLALLFPLMAEGTGDGSVIAAEKDPRPRVAWFVENGVAPVTPAVADAVKRAAQMLAEAGYEVCEELPPAIGEGPRLWVELFSRAAAEQLRNLYDGREQDAGPGLLPSLRPGGAATFEEKIANAESVAKAIVERERLREELLRWMKKTPVILSPVSATTAFAHGAQRVEVQGHSLSVFRSCSYSQAINVFGLPAATVPVLRDPEGLPAGVQIIGGPFNEAAVLRAAQVIEKSAEFF